MPDAAGLVEGAADVERQAVLVDRVILELRVAFRAHRIPSLFQRAAFHGDPLRWLEGAFDEITRAFNRPFNGVLADQGAPPSRCDRIHVIGLDVIERLPPVAEVSVAAIAGRMILHDIAREHDVLIRHMDHRITRRMGAADVFDINATFAQIDGHAVAECGGRVSQPGD